MRIVKILSVLFISIFIWSACDKIEEPFVKETGGNEPIDTTQFVKKVLLEDYTGHKCVNCPSAALVAHELSEQYEDRLIVVAMHAGFFAEPSFEPYTMDFTTDEGDELNSYFQIQSNPSGIINRVEHSGSILLTDYENSWGSAVGAEMSKEAVAKIDIMNDFIDASAELTTTVEVEFKVLNTNPVYMCAFIVESGIIAPQKNNNEDIGETPEILDYVHNHVFRASMNGTWGEELVNPQNLIYTVDIPAYTLNSEWVSENCGVVVFIYDQVTLEVLQAEELDVISE